jgi:hypothetical protein
MPEVREDHGDGWTGWGLLGPSGAGGERRSRTLGLAATVRVFNDLAVPGLGGIWFAKPLVLSALGVSVAARAGRTNIEVTNAIEALACWLAFDANGWARDPRLRGSTKLRGRDDLSYATVRRAGFYVTQPMRQQTVQPLVALELVDASSERFNAFGLAAPGVSLLVDAFMGLRPHNQSVEDVLTGWVMGKNGDKSVATSKLCEALSPLQKLPEACRERIKSQFVSGKPEAAGRRRAALDWVQALRGKSATVLDWNDRPAPVADDHWRDLQCGGRFFAARDAALKVLDAAETAISPMQEKKLPLTESLPDTVRTALATLKERAAAFREMLHDPSPARMATAFAQQCHDLSAIELLAELVHKDGRGLILRDRCIVPGPAYRGGEQQLGAHEDGADESEEVSNLGTIKWPEGISPRLSNLFLLNLDLEGELEQWLHPPSGTA